MYMRIRRLWDIRTYYLYIHTYTHTHTHTQKDEYIKGNERMRKWPHINKHADPIGTREHTHTRAYTHHNLQVLMRQTVA